MRFVEKLEFSGDPAEIWSRLSNLKTIPMYWHGTREFTATKSGEKTIADVVFAFGGRGRANVIIDDGARTFTLDYFEGPFKGRQTIAVGDGQLEATWDVSFKGAYKLLQPWNGSHFRSGTRNALKRLTSDSEQAYPRR